MFGRSPRRLDYNYVVTVSPRQEVPFGLSMTRSPVIEGKRILDGRTYRDPQSKETGAYRDASVSLIGRLYGVRLDPSVMDEVGDITLVLVFTLDTVTGTWRVNTDLPHSCRGKARDNTTTLLRPLTAAEQTLLDALTTAFTTNATNPSPGQDS